MPPSPRHLTLCFSSLSSYSWCMLGAPPPPFEQTNKRAYWPSPPPPYTHSHTPPYPHPLSPHPPIPLSITPPYFLSKQPRLLPSLAQSLNYHYRTRLL